MISFERFTPEGGIPIYLQIILHIKRGIVAGAIIDGDEMPSRRVLSALLGINPNTVQKAYRMLESEGLILSHTGAKSYVSLTPDVVARVRRELLERDARRAVQTLKQMGLTREEALSCIQLYWDEEPEKQEVHDERNDQDGSDIPANGHP